MPDNNFNFRDPNYLWNCMDIVPWGPSQMQNPSDELIQAWNDDIGQELVEGRENYLYLRTQNTTRSSQSTRLYLYVTPPSIFTQPSRWTQLSATNGNNYVEVSAEPLGKVAPSDAFVWTPETTSHFCAIAIASTSDNPLPSSFSSVGAYEDWVFSNSGVAWRNLHQQEVSSNVWEGNLLFGNPESSAETYAFSINVTGINPQEITPHIVASCSEGGPNPPINWTVDGTDLFRETQLPAGFEGVLNISVTLPGVSSWPTGARVLAQAFKVDVPGGQEQLLVLGRYNVHG